MEHQTVNDVLSDTLMKMRLKSSVASMIDAGGQWAVASARVDGFKLNLVLQGEKWIAVEGHRQRYHLKAGDCLLMTGGAPFVSASDLSITRRSKIADLKSTAQNGLITLNGGGGCLSIGTHFQFDGHLPKLIFAHLPTVMFIAEHLDQAAVLRWSIERFRAELLGEHVGRLLVLNHLAPIMLLQILRIHLAEAKNEKSWLAALSDPKLSKAIEAMHTDYAAFWSLEKLANVAGMSRSRFALHFKQHVGVPPMEYLTHWRMQIACDLLRDSEHNVATVANAVGYDSASAFSLAFQKVVKCRPGFYQRSLAPDRAPTAAPK